MHISSRKSSRVSQRDRRFAGASMVALVAGACLAGPAFAQQAANPAPEEKGTVSELVVTASRINNGYAAATPTTVISSLDIQRAGESTVFDVISKLPELAGNTTTQTYGTGQSGANAGVSTLNLRGLGTNRTLTLLDGQRVVGALTTGVTDAAAFPQGLVKRVDVVTGGASASWGSDAVAGVVNYVLDHNFNGFKGTVSAGETNYGDDRQGDISLSAGTGFLNDRAHFEISGEYSKNRGIPQGNGGRTWDDQTKILQQSITGAPAGTPQYIVAPNVYDFQMAPGGIITAGPLRNIAFGPGGAPYNFQIGLPVASPYSSGGTVSNLASNAVLDAPLRRQTIYTRLSYDLTPNVNVYATFNYGAVHTSAHSYQGEYKPANLTIQCANAYLPASITAACAANNISSFQFGTWNMDLPDTIGVNDRNQTRYVIGGNGGFEALGTHWTWDAYATHGETDSSSKILNNSLTPLYNLAIDAIVGPTGSIVCRSTLTNPTNGCVPLNVIGTGVASPAAITSILGTPYLDTFLRQEAASFTLNGAPFSLWAGPVSVATGVEWRRESFNQSADAFSQGNGGNPLLSASGNNWFTGNFHPSQGSYSVTEGFLEAALPIIRSDTLGSANLDVAVRYTDYSTSGQVTTWKVGGTWETPVEGLRFRAIRSRDIRAPNLSELYTASSSLTSQLINDFAPSAGQTFNVLQSTTGNTALRPEIAQTTEAGVVWQPTFIPGFSVSIDYYRINLNGAVGTISPQQEMDLCFQGDKSLCSLITFNATGAPTAIKLVPINLASTLTDGFDIEASYHMSLDKLLPRLGGELNLRSLATHVSTYRVNSGLPNAPVQDLVGQYPPSSNAIASWRWFGTESYSNGPWSVTLGQRYMSDGVLSNAYIECTSNCPTSTINNPTINNNHVKGVFLWDLGGSYDMNLGDRGPRTQLFFKINNLTNVDPPKVPTGGGLAFLSRAYNPALTDSLGRFMRIGVRFNF
jgi:iron complex outermembrane receptor protein